MPDPVRAPLEGEMLEIFGESEFVSEQWLVGPEGGLANCAVSLHPLEGTEVPVVEPVAGAIFDKVGPYYRPQVLVVTCGTEVTLRNRESPCRGFMARTSKNRGFNVMIVAGGERTWLAEREEAVRVGCDLRPYVHGTIVIVDTPYYAATDEAGHFTIEGVVPGSYRLRAFHEGLGYWLRDRTVEVDGVSDVSLELRTSATPRETGRRRR